ncbi:MAG: glutamate--tRNA ligase, partial [Lachnospiraceae bacterium]|nr:glutamate--tRNA ligase [Lachnospiraceae bacterium]
ERLTSLTTEAGGETITHYDKHCLSLSKEEVEVKLAAGEPFVIRQNIPREGTTTFTDANYGEITIENSELDDQILIKSDGFPTYNFANVIDDHLMKISHVVRGNEYISSTPKYTRLYQAFGWQEPVYVHLPLITNEEHQKLSKRSGHSSFEDLLDQGFVPEAIVNFVALLGWSSADNREILSLKELIDEFDYTKISKSPAVFDMVKLRWMNGEYLKAMDDEKYYEMAVPYVQKVVTKDYDLKAIAALVKTRIETLCDIPDMIDFFEELPDYDIEMYTHKKMKTNSENSLTALQDLLPRLEALQKFDNDSLSELVAAYVAEKEIKNGMALWPLRTAVSGKQTTPGGAYEIMTIIGKDESLKRIRKGIEKLTNA